MRGNIKFLEQTFSRFNEIIFKTPLPKPEMHISSARSFLGQFRLEKKGFLGRKSIYHLTLSDRYDLPEEVLEDTIIHEMIHFYIFYNNFRDTSSHGEIFRTLMNEINSRFGRHITVSHRCTPDQLDSDNRKAHSIICLCTMTDGRQLICKVSQSKVFEIYGAFKEWDKVSEQEWYWVYGSYFNRYRRVLTPKLFPVDEEGINLVRSGTRLEFITLPDGRMNLRSAR